MRRSNLCDYSDAYIVVKGDITVDKEAFIADDIEEPNDIAANVTATNTSNDNALGEKKLVFKSNTPFINCVSKINGLRIANAEDLDVVMSMYNLLEYSKNFVELLQRWASTDANNITHSILNSEPFDYNINFIEDGVTQNNLTKNDVKIVVPLKHFSNFWRSLNIPLIDCKIELILTWFENCVLISKATREANYGANPVVYEIDNHISNNR